MMQKIFEKIKAKNFTEKNYIKPQIQESQSTPCNMKPKYPILLILSRTL